MNAVLVSALFFATILAAQAVAETWIDTFYHCHSFKDHLAGAMVGAVGGVLPGSVRGLVKVFYDCQVRQENAAHMKQWLRVSMWAPAFYVVGRFRFWAVGPGNLLAWRKKAYMTAPNETRMLLPNDGDFAADCPELARATPCPAY